MPDRRSGARDAGYLVGSQIVASACSFLSGVALARALGPAGKGYFDIAVGSATLLSTFTGLSLSSGVFYYAARGEVDERQLLRLTLGLALVQAAVIAPVLLLLGGHEAVAWLLPGGSRRTAALLIVVLLAALQAQQILQAIAKGRGRFRAFAASELLARGGALAAAVAFAVAGARSAEPFVASLAVATAAATVLLAAVTRRGAPAAAGPAPLRAVVLYSLPLYLGNAVQFLNYKLDIFFVKSYVGLGAVGKYTVAVWLAQIVWLIPNALAALVMRAVAEQDGAGEVMRRVTAVARLSLYVSCLSMAGLAVAGSVGVAALFGRDFRDSVSPLLFLAPGVVLFCPTIILSAYLNGVRAQSYTTAIACGSLVVTVVLNLLLVPRMAIDGAAVASSVSYTLSTVATVWAVRRLNSDLSVAALFVPQPADLAWIRTAARVSAASVRDFRFVR